VERCRDQVREELPSGHVGRVRRGQLMQQRAEQLLHRVVAKGGREEHADRGRLTARLTNTAHIRGRRSLAKSGPISAPVTAAVRPMPAEPPSRAAESRDNVRFPSPQAWDAILAWTSSRRCRSSRPSGRHGRPSAMRPWTAHHDGLQRVPSEHGELARAMDGSTRGHGSPGQERLR
jgi:hypothetical protein